MEGSRAVTEVPSRHARQRVARSPLLTRPALPTLPCPGRHPEAARCLCDPPRLLRTSKLSLQSPWGEQPKTPIRTLISQLPRDGQRGHPTPSFPFQNLGLCIPQMLHITGHSKVTNAHYGSCPWLPNVPHMSRLHLQVPRPPPALSSPRLPPLLKALPVIMSAPSPGYLDIPSFFLPFSLPFFPCPGTLPLGLERSSEIENSKKKKIKEIAR